MNGRKSSGCAEIISLRASVFAALGAALTIGGCQPDDLSRPPKEDTERHWGISPSGLYQETGIALLFAGENDDDYLLLRCSIDAPSKVSLYVKRFQSAPYGDATISNSKASMKLQSVSQATWKANWKDESTHQFESDLQDIEKILRSNGTATITLASEADRERRSFPIAGSCPTRFVEFCQQLWRDHSVADTKSNYSCK